MKPYLKRVEYLQSDGNQYIDTGIYIDDTCGYYINAQRIASGDVIAIGVCGTGDSRWIYNIGNYVNLSWNTIYHTLDSNYTAQRHEAYMNYKNDRKRIVDGVAYNNITDTLSTNAGEYTVCLFGAKWRSETVSQKMQGKIYKAQITKGTKIIADFIPVLDNNNKPAMYDNISGQLFYNLGTGEFTYGREIKQVEYLESNGTQYIDTGYIPKNNSGFKIDFSNLGRNSNDFNFFGCRVNGGQRWAVNFNNVGSGDCFGWCFNNYNYTTLPFDLTARHTATLNLYNNRKWSFDGNEGDITDTITATLPTCLLFAGHSSNTTYKYAYRLYSCVFTEDTKIVRNYVPAIDENNVPFMFDQVSNMAFENIGTGNFVYGNLVTDKETNVSKKLLRKKLALSLTKKRPYYCEVEYIESNGTQYIDTGVLAKSGTSSILNFEYTNLSSTSSMLDARVGNDRFYCCHAGKPSSDYYFYYGYGSARQSSVIPVINKRYVIETDLSIDSQSMKVNGTTILTGNSTVYYNLGVNLYLFAMNYSTAQYLTSAKLYSCKIMNEGYVVRDFIPVLDWNYTPCFYDKVTGRLFYNKGTGSFTYGREIHYTDYIESTGTQYIDTKFVGDQNTRFKIDIQLTNTTEIKAVFGSRTYNGSIVTRGKYFYPITASSGTLVDKFQFGYASDLYREENITNPGARYVIDLDKNKVILNGVLKNTFTTATFTNPTSLLIFNCHTGSSGTELDTRYGVAKVYSCQIWDNDTIARDYLPAIDENGTGFLFDKVTHTIYDNAGSGVFSYPAREIEYLESTGTQYIDMGVNTWDNTLEYEIKLGIKQQSGVRTYFGCYDTWSAEGRIVPAINTFVSSYRMQDNFNTGFISSSGTVIGIQNGQTGVISLRGDVLSWSEGTSLLFNRGESFTKTNLPIILFGTYYGGGAKELASFPMGYANFWLDGVLVRELIPCFKDGSAGMYDKVNNVFYGNAGSGSFGVGKIVESEWE